MAGTRLFKPNDSLDVPSPTTPNQTNGNIVNPPNYAQFGGLSSGSPRGLKKNDKILALPGNSISKVPAG